MNRIGVQDVKFTKKVNKKLKKEKKKKEMTTRVFQLRQEACKVKVYLGNLDFNSE